MALARCHSLGILKREAHVQSARAVPNPCIQHANASTTTCLEIGAWSARHGRQGGVSRNTTHRQHWQRAGGHCAQRCAAPRMNFKLYRLGRRHPIDSVVPLRAPPPRGWARAVSVCEFRVYRPSPQSRARPASRAHEAPLPGAAGDYVSNTRHPELRPLCREPQRCGADGGLDNTASLSLVCSPVLLNATLAYTRQTSCDSWTR